MSDVAPRFDRDSVRESWDRAADAFDRAQTSGLDSTSSSPQVYEEQADLYLQYPPCFRGVTRRSTSSLRWI
jgi:hypothetical protein